MGGKIERDRDALPVAQAIDEDAAKGIEILRGDVSALGDGSLPCLDGFQVGVEESDGSLRIRDKVSLTRAVGANQAFGC